MSSPRKNHRRYEMVKKLRKQGMKFSDIARKLDISRQRVWQIHARITQKA